MLPVAESISAQAELKACSVEGYLVSRDGSVYSLWDNRGQIGDTPRPVKTYVACRGHIYVTLRVAKNKCKHFHIARLVLEAFVGPCPDGMEACHSPDRNPENNRLENLRWDTPKQNSEDRTRHGTQPFGERSHLSRYTDEQVLKVRDMASRGYTQEQIAAATGVGRSSVSMISSGRRWAHLPGAVSRLKRGPRVGPENRSAKLSDEQVAEIRSLCAARTLTRREIARKFGIHKQTVSNIHTGKYRKPRAS